MSEFESFLKQQLKEYVAYRKNTGYAMKTTLSHLKTFDQYLKSRKYKGEWLQPSFFLEFKADLKIEPTSINGIISSVRTFFKYLVRKDYYNENPLQDIPELPGNNIIPFIFSPQEINQLLTALCKRLRWESSHYFIDYSRYMAILLLARCGMRISEPLRMKLEHYRKKERTLYIEKTKFNKDRLIPVPKSVVVDIENYLSVRRTLITTDQNPYLLPGNNQKRLHHNTVRWVFHRAVKDIGLNRSRQVIGKMVISSPTPHSVRHSFAVNTLKSVKERGKSPQNALPVLAAYMGHRCYEHTTYYLKLLDARQHRRLVDFVNIHRDEDE